MNYKKIHDGIINNSRNQARSKKTGFYEEHHIKPKAVYPELKKEKSNLVLLTPKEHFIVHYLLWKMNPNDRRYRDPIFMFKHKGSGNSRLYEAARIEHILEMKNDNPSLSLSESAKLSKSEKLKNYVRTEEHRKNISESKKGKSTRIGAVLSESSKKKISNSIKRWHKEVGISESTREKHRKRMTGFKHSNDSIENMKQRARARKKYKCKVCGKDNLDPGNFTQHCMRSHSIKKEDAKKYIDD